MKYVLFLVEGDSDEKYINGILKTSEKFKNNYLAVFIPLVFKNKGKLIKIHDITANYNIKENNVKGIIQDNIVNFFRQNHAFNKSNIAKIVHVLDLDGAFIGRDNIIKDESKNFYYTLDGIYSDNVDQVVQRNGHKQKLLKVLIETNQINSIPYNLYFNSVNIEHVLFGDEMMNLNQEQKKSKSIEFNDSCSNGAISVDQLIIFDKQVGSDEYKKSWDNVKSGLNSLHRKTNINLALKDLL